MASPLRWFRKYSMYIMVVFGIAAMVIFGFGSVIDSMISRSGSQRSNENDVVVATWKGGDIRRGQLRMMRNRHFQTQRFLEAIYSASAKQKGEDFRPAVRMIRPLSPSLNEEQFDDQLLTRFLLAERAKEEGFVVNDRMVYDYIAEVAGGMPISKNEMRAINRKINHGDSDLEHIVQNLKMELLGQQMSVLASGGMPVIPNATEAMQLYDRTRRQVECEVMPFSVEEYVSKVTEEPSRSEMREIYDQGRYEYPDPTGKRPGFKVGKKVKIKYFVADYNTFLENEMNKLTPEEIQKEYERLVEAKDNLVMEVVPDEKPLTTEKSNAEDPAPTLEGAQDDPAPALESIKNDADKNDADKNQGIENQGNKNEGNKNEADQEPGGKNQTDESGSSSDDSKSESDAGQSNVIVKTDSQYTSIQDENEAAQDEPAQEKPAEDEAAQDQPNPSENKENHAEQQPTPAESLPEKPPGEPDAVSQAIGEKEAPLDNPAAEKQSTEPAGPTFDDKPEIKRRPKPLKDVVDDIKRQLKAADATAALNKALDDAEGELRKHQMQYSRWQSRKYDGEKIDPPAEIDYKSVADKFGLQFNETGLIDRRQISDEAIGKIVSFEMGSDNRPRTIDIGQSIFDNYYETSEFEPRRADDFATRSTYLYWLTEKVDQKVPDFDAAIPEIIKFWKRKKALELAKQDAQAVADNINGGQMLSVLYPEKSNVTGRFSWFSNLGQIRYSTPIGVAEAGDEFMETVFDLKENQAGVALNDSHDTVYVIQLIKESEVSIEEIGNEYLEKQFFTFKHLPNEVTTLAEIYLRKLNFQWQDEFLDDMQLKWIAR